LYGKTVCLSSIRRAGIKKRSVGNVEVEMKHPAVGREVLLQKGDKIGED